MKKVSVIMPAYNADKFIEESIVSIINQSYEEWTLTIVNDGSKDNTKQIIQKYVDLYPQKIVLIDKAQNEGTVSGLNTLIDAVNGDYVCWLSADDLYTKDMLKESVEYLNAHEEYDLVFSDYETIDEESDFLRSSPYKKGIEELRIGNTCQPYQHLMTVGCCIHGCTVMLRNYCFQGVGKFDAKYRYAHDYDMWLRIAAKYRIGYIDSIHVQGREYKTQISMQGNNEVDAIRVLFDFIESKDFENLYSKAGYQNQNKALYALITNQLKTYKHKEREFDELLKCLLNAKTKKIEEFWKEDQYSALYSNIEWLKAGKWNLRETFFEDETEDSYLKALCEIMRIDAICINKQAIRFDRFEGNSMERFNKGLMRSNDIVIGTTTLNHLSRFLEEHGLEYRNLIVNSKEKDIKVGITYYMYMMMKIDEKLHMKDVQLTKRDIWWSLVEEYICKK